MTIFKIILLVLATLLLAAVALGLWVNSRDRGQAARVWATREGAREADPPPYDPAMVADLPEVAQRYFARAITPGTPLHRVVRLEMSGSFIMNGNPMPMPPSFLPISPRRNSDMIAAASAPILLRLSDAAAVLTLAAVAAALLLPDAYAAVPDHLRPGAWSQDTISAPAALALLAVNARLRQGWDKGWMIWAGLMGYLIYAYALYSFDRVMNPAWPLYLAILSLSVFAALMFVRAVDPAALKTGQRPPPRRAVAGLTADSPAAAGHGRRPVWPVLLAFALVYGFGRTGVQMLGLIDSGLAQRLLPSLIWPFAMGAAIGVLFLALGDALRGLSRGTAALAFGLGAFGANWALFMVFVPMVFPNALPDTALRVGVDALLITGAAFLVGVHRPGVAGLTELLRISDGLAPEQGHQQQKKDNLLKVCIN